MPPGPEPHPACPEGHVWDESSQDCLPLIPECPEGYGWDPYLNDCRPFAQEGGVPDEMAEQPPEIPPAMAEPMCPPGMIWNEVVQNCVPIPAVPEAEGQPFATGQNQAPTPQPPPPQPQPLAQIPVKQIPIDQAIPGNPPPPRQEAVPIAEPYTVTPANPGWTPPQNSVTSRGGSPHGRRPKSRFR